MNEARHEEAAAWPAIAAATSTPRSALWPATHFALFARGDTKGTTTAEWEWLETQTDLAAFGIGDHTPFLCIAAPIALHVKHGRIDLGAIPDFLGLSPITLEAAARADEGVLWLPGFPPGWWQTSVARPPRQESPATPIRPASKSR